MKLGLRISDLQGMTTTEKTQLAVDQQLEAIELSAAELEDHQQTKYWKQVSEDYGLNIKTAGIGIELCNPATQGQTRERLKRIIEGAHILGGVSLFSRTMTAPEGMAQQEVWEHLTAFTREVTETLAEEKLIFAIEIDHAPCFVHTLERFEKLYRLVDHNNLHLNFDPTNLHVNGSDPFEAIDLWGERFIGGHIKDGVFRTEKRSEVPLGEGEIDYRLIFSKLKEKELDLTFQFEHLSTKKEVEQAVDTMRKMLVT